MSIFFVPAIMFAAGDRDSMLAFGLVGPGLLIMIAVGIIITLISAIGTIRFVHKGSMGQVFAFGAIFEHMGRSARGVTSSLSSSCGSSGLSLVLSAPCWR